MKLFYATTNDGKVASLQKRLEDVEVVKVPLDIPEPRASHVEEIALAKAQIAYRELQHPVVVNDSGFYIDSLKGFPRAYVNFALETIGLDGILRLVRDDASRQCKFRECMVFTDGDEDKIFVGEVYGTVADSKRGYIKEYHWSPLSQIFIPEGYNKTMAEMNEAELGHWRLNRASKSSSDLFAEWFRVWNRKNIEPH